MATDSKLTEIRQPKWLKPSMTVETAARKASERGCILKATWNCTMGLVIIAVPKQ